MPVASRVLIVGVGNELRGDDGAGIAALRALRPRAEALGVAVAEEQGEATSLLHAWDGRAAVVLVDAMRSGAPPGTLRRLDASTAPLPAGVVGATSSHAVALGDAIELARVLGRLPPRVVVHAVEGAIFDVGAGLSDPVRDALSALEDAVLADARSLAREQDP